MSNEIANSSALIVENAGKIFQGGGGGGTGTVESLLKIYWESSCVNEVSNIDWGTLNPSQSKNMPVYVKNGGTVPLTLALSTRGWTPASAEQYLTLTWDYGSQVVQASEVLEITLTLTVSPSVTGVTNFSFEIVILATSS